MRRLVDLLSYKFMELCLPTTSHLKLPLSSASILLLGQIFDMPSHEQHRFHQQCRKPLNDILSNQLKGCAVVPGSLTANGAESLLMVSVTPRLFLL